MENERIEPIVVLNNVEYYKEEDMLKAWSIPRECDNFGRIISMEDDGFIRESIVVENGIGICMNSIPVYARYQREVGNGCRRWYEGEGVHKHSFVIENGTYETICPKIAKGFMAYCVLHVEKDDEIGLCYNKKKLFNGYFNVCATIHNEVCEVKYRRYKDMGRDDLKIKLDYDFYQQHIDSERIYKASSVELDKTFFDGELSSLLDEYLNWVEAKAVQINLSVRNDEAIEPKAYDISNIPMERRFSPLDTLPLKSIFEYLEKVGIIPCGMKENYFSLCLWYGYWNDMYFDINKQNDVRYIISVIATYFEDKRNRTSHEYRDKVIENLNRDLRCSMTFDKFRKFNPSEKTKIGFNKIVSKL